MLADAQAWLDVRLASRQMMPGIDEPTLSTGVTRVRRWRLDDVGLVEQASSDRELLLGTTLPADYSPSEGKAFIERQWGRAAAAEGVSLAIEFEGTPVGCVTVMLRRPRVGDLGYWLVRDAREKGVGTTAVCLVSRWALEHLEIDSLDAFVSEANVPSRRLLSRLGFAHVGQTRHVVNELDAELLVYRRTRASHST